MQISRILYIPNINKNNIINKKQVNRINTDKKFPQIQNISNVYLGRDIVSFGKLDFKQTLDKNYFCLPKNCRPDAFQVEAGIALNNGKNVLVEAPTGTGKTAIAHYAVSKNMEEGKTTFYTTPLKALSNQKLDEFRAVYGDDKVGILTGDRRENVEAPIIIMTTEVYRNMALSNMYGQKNPLMENLGTVIFDEFHYLDDASRGSVWEESLMYTPKGIQTLELSATIGNPQELRNWIGSLDDTSSTELISMPAEARHVPLKFDSFITGSYKAEEKRIRNDIKKGRHSGDYASYELKTKPGLSDFKNAVSTLNSNKQLPAIFFVFSRGFSRELLQYLEQEGSDLTTPQEKEEISKILDKYKSEKYIGRELDESALLKGYAVHNAGIIPVQKQLIEELFQKKLIKTVIATETLAAGINMPAKTVVISSPYKPCDEEYENDENGTNENNSNNQNNGPSFRLLTPNEFKQMAGRAGRRGIDTIGYVYTMPTNRNSEQEFLSLEVLPSNSINSRYNPDYAFLSGYYEHNNNMSGLKDIYSRSFYVNSSSSEGKNEKISELMNMSLARTNVLKDHGFIETQNGEITLTPQGYMASKVRGYDAIALSEVVSGKKMEGITPEALAAVAGVIANDVDSSENELSFNPELEYIFQPVENYINSVYKELRTSANAKFKSLGRDINSFSDFNEMLEYAQNIQKPNSSRKELKDELDRLFKLRSKVYVIMKQTGKYTPQTLVFALMNKDVVPSKVLNDYFDVVEKYKKSINVASIDDYIEKLNNEIKSMDTTAKGNKAKARIERKKSEIAQELNNAMNMKYLDENLYSALEANNKFLKKNPPEDIKKQYRKVEEEYTRLTAKDSLIQQIKGMKQITDYKNKHNIVDESSQNHSKVISCINELITKTLGVKESERKEGLVSPSVHYGSAPVQILYTWALLNKINPESISNWNQLQQVVSDEKIDEGLIYQNIMRAADLISQINEMAQVGYDKAETAEDREYYRNLQNTASEARKLIIRKPISVK